MYEEGYIIFDEVKNVFVVLVKVVCWYIFVSDNYVVDWVMDVLLYFVGFIDGDIIVDIIIDLNI